MAAMATALRLFVSLGALFSMPNALTIQGMEVTEEVSQADIQRAMSEAVAGDSADVQAIARGQEGDYSQRAASSSEDEEVAASQREGDEHMLSAEQPQISQSTDEPEMLSARQPPMEEVHVSRKEIIKAENVARNSTEDTTADDAQAREMAEFDAKHPAISTKKEEDFQNQMQKVLDETTGAENEEEAEQEMKVHEMKRQRQMSAGGQYDTVEDVQEKMANEAQGAAQRKKELAGFDDFFAGMVPTGKNAAASASGQHSPAALAALVPPSAAKADSANLMGMFSSMMGGMMGGASNIGATIADKPSISAVAAPADHQPQSAATIDLMSTLTSMAKGVAKNDDLVGSLEALVKTEHVPSANEAQQADAPKVADVVSMIEQPAPVPTPAPMAVLRRTALVQRVRERRAALRAAAVAKQEKLQREIVAKRAQQRLAYERIAQQQALRQRAAEQQIAQQQAAQALKLRRQVVRVAPTPVRVIRVAPKPRAVAMVQEQDTSAEEAEAELEAEALAQSAVTVSTGSGLGVAAETKGEVVNLDDKEVSDAEKAAAQIDAEISAEVDTSSFLQRIL